MNKKYQKELNIIAVKMNNILAKAKIDFPNANWFAEGSGYIFLFSEEPIDNINKHFKKLEPITLARVKINDLDCGGF